MAKATVRQSAAVAAAPAETPAASVVSAANESVTVTTPAGRVLVVSRLNALKRMRLFKILGDDARNQMYLGTAATACAVTSIDGAPVSFPASQLEVEALVGRLDDDGITAASEALAKIERIEVDGEGNITRDGKVLRAAKN